MNSLDRITLKSFLAALLRQNSSLPDALQKKLNEVSATFAEKINILSLLTEEYQPLEEEYYEARAILQNDGERKRSSVVETITPRVEINDEAVLNFATKVFSMPDSVASLKRAYAQHSAVRSLFEELDYPSIEKKQATDISSEAEASSKKAQIYDYNINIAELIGKTCIAPSKGKKVYGRIHPRLLAGHSVELDFSGVEICGTPFLSFAIGQLLKDIPLEKLNQLLTINNLDTVGQETLEIIFEDYSQYYSDAQFRSTVDRVISELAPTL